MRKLAYLFALQLVTFLALFQIASAAAYATGVGGTGTTSPQGILYGSGSANPLKTLSIGSGLTFSSGILSATTQSFSTSSADYWKSTNNFYSTTSANFWSTVGLGFSTTSTAYYLTQFPPASFSTTSAAYFASLGLAHSTTSVAYQLSQVDKGYFFSTTSADAWKAQRNFFSTTSADYWETQQTARTADDLTNNSIEDLSDVAAMTENLGDLLYWNGSSWADTATSSLFNIAASGVTGLLSGTDWTTFNSKESALTFSGPFTRSGNTITWTGLSTTSQPASSNILVSNGAAGVYGVSTTSGTVSSPLTGSLTCLGSCSLGIQQATASQNGYLSSSDWGSFNSRLSTTTLGLFDKGYFFSTSSATVFSGVGLAFSTTSSNYWATQGLGFSSTSASYFLSQNIGNAFSTTSANYWAARGLAFSTTSDNYWAAQGLAFSTTSQNYYFQASTTVPTTYKDNTFTGTNAFQNVTAAGATTTSLAVTGNSSSTGLTVSGIRSAAIITSAAGIASAYAGATCTNQFVRSLSALIAATCASVDLANDVTGILGAARGGTGIDTSGSTGVMVVNSGTWSASSTLAVLRGGTGSTTLSGVLKGNGTGGVQTAVAGTDYLAPASLSAVTPISYSSGTGVFSWLGLATTSQPSSSNLLVSNGAAGVYGAATTSASCSGTVSCTAFTILGSSPITITGAAGTSASTTLLTDTNTFTGTNNFGNITATGATTTSLSVSGNASTTGLWVSSVRNGLLNTSATGQVQSTSFSGPISFTGGTLTLSQSNATTNGYLSSSDWGSFNGRLSTTTFNILTAQGLGFSTTSANFWSTAGLGFSTTSGNYFALQGLGFSTTSENYYQHASGTVVTTYKSNTFTGTNTFANITATGATTTSLSNSGNASTTGLTISGLVSCTGSSALQTSAVGQVQCGTVTASFATTSANFWASTGLSFSTTSSNFWASAGLAFSTTSAVAWANSTTTTGFSTTSANNWRSVGLSFSTTSSNFWSTAGLGFSTTSSTYWATWGLGFSTTSANYWAAQGLGFSTTSLTAWFTSLGSSFPALNRFAFASSTPSASLGGGIIGTTTVLMNGLWATSFASSTANLPTVLVQWGVASSTGMAGNRQFFLLQQNTTFILNSTSSQPGLVPAYFEMILCQDNTGGRTVTWGNPGSIGWAFPDGSATPTLKTTANTGVKILFDYQPRTGRYFGIATTSVSDTRYCVP